MFKNNMTLSVILLVLLILLMVPMSTQAKSQINQTLVIGTGRDAARPGNFQPMGMWEPACLIYETLVNLDTGSTPLPCLAKSWDVSTDGTIYTFHLRKGVQFHDGTPFNAEAVKTNFEQLGPLNWQAIYPAIRQVSVVDDETIRFTLKRPIPLFFIHLAGSAYGIVAPSAIQKSSGTMTGLPKKPESSNAQPRMTGRPKAGDGQKPMMTMASGKKMSAMPKAMMAAMQGQTYVVPNAIGTGPYQWDAMAYRRAQSFKVIRNNGYWQGTPAFERIIWKVIPDPAARTIALETGDIHLTGQSPNASMTEANVIALKMNGNIRMTKATNWGARLVIINHTRPPFDRVAVRAAIRRGIDYPAIQKVMQEMATVCPGPFGPDTPYTHPAIRLPDPEPAAAGAMLNKAGLVDTDGDGIREYNGRPLKIQFTSSKSATMALLVCESLKKIGIQASLRPKERGSIFEVLKQMDFDIAVHPNIPSFYLGLYDTFHSKGRWTARFNMPEMDRLLGKYRAATDTESFRALGQQVQEMVDKQHIILFAINESKLAAYDKRLGEFKFPPEEWVGGLQDIWRSR